jgi:hypothetical protein
MEVISFFSLQSIDGYSSSSQTSLGFFAYQKTNGTQLGEKKTEIALFLSLHYLDKIITEFLPLLTEIKSAYILNYVKYKLSFYFYYELRRDYYLK